MKPSSLLRLSSSDFVMAAEAAALVLPVEIALRRRVSLDTLLPRCSATDRTGPGERHTIDVARAARLVQAVTACYPLGTCLKRSLILFRLLRRRGIPAELRLGVRTVEGTFSAHAWIECGGRTLLDDGMAPLYSTLPLSRD
jgi:hypothetical protein